MGANNHSKCIKLNTNDYTLLPSNPSHSPWSHVFNKYLNRLPTPCQHWGQKYKDEPVCLHCPQFTLQWKGQRAQHARHRPPHLTPKNQEKASGSRCEKGASSSGMSLCADTQPRWRPQVIPHTDAPRNCEHLCSAEPPTLWAPVSATASAAQARPWSSAALLPHPPGL